MFNEYSPLGDAFFQIMDNDGRIFNTKWAPELSDESLVKAYKDMSFARTADIMAVSYQRQGRMFTYPPNFGQEAVSGGLAYVMREQDWMVPAFRELGAWLAKGASLKDIFLYFMGYEDGNAFKNAPRLLPVSVPIASQLLHAVGIAYASKIRGLDEVTYTVVGDGGTSEGDFHEALNFAAVWKVPVVFVIQNNQFAISLPVSRQTVSENLAVKSVAYGMPGIKVDGNDYLAMVRALQEARDHALRGEGPVLIEALTYRRGAHTTSDDPTRYRSKEEEDHWALTDPLNRMKLLLMSKNLWTEEEEKNITTNFKAEVDRQFLEAEQYGPYDLADVFRYTYVDMPDDLKKQQVEYEKFLKWKEGSK